MYKRKIYDQLLHWKNTSNGKTAVLKDWFFFSLLQHIPLPSICTPEALLMAYKKSWQKLLTLSLKYGILPLERYSKENASRRKISYISYMKYGAGAVEEGISGGVCEVIRMFSVVCAERSS